MSRFLNATISDMRGGRDTWRVLVVLSSAAFVITVALQQVS
jgi:hypothetical protein